LARPDYTHYEDEQLLNLLAHGDEAAFTAIYDRYRDKLYSFAFDLSRSREKALDIVHDVFARLWENRATLAGREVGKSYLYRMTRNRRIDLIRRWARETLILAELAREKPDSNETPGTRLDHREIQAVLGAAIGRLSPRQREIYQLHREEGLSYNEVAERLGLSSSTVENHFTRALQNIRDHIHTHFTETLFYALLLGAASALTV